MFKRTRNTVGILNPDVTGFQMVDSRSGSKWSGFRMPFKIRTKKSGFQKVNRRPSTLVWAYLRMTPLDVHAFQLSTLSLNW